VSSVLSFHFTTSFLKNEENPFLETETTNPHLIAYQGLVFFGTAVVHIWVKRTTKI